uniref:Protein kinase domain-containing protein n=1 Tax=Macrostomum lignano TaxID=282301 RepID=A0A1I8INU2_9PLAT
MKIYLLCDLMQTDLHKIIVSPQSLPKVPALANILHRDIKPGNLLVNSDCKLKICDPLASPDCTIPILRVAKVVTQYYRAPELLMGAQEYTEAIDIWSAGCILAELLSRSILFQASSPLSQLDLILDLLGTPDPSDLLTACTAARRHVLRQKLASKLWQTSRTVSEEGLHLLQQLLRFNPKHRISAAAALSHPYLSGARIRYHSCMCTCCNRGSDSIDSGTPASPRRYEHASDFAEPVHLPSAPGEIDGRLAQEATVTDSKEAAARLQELARQINSADSRNLCAPLRINRRAVNYRAFVKSAVAQVSERAPSPHRWEKH